MKDGEAARRGESGSSSMVTRSSEGDASIAGPRAPQPFAERRDWMESGERESRVRERISSTSGERGEDTVQMPLLVVAGGGATAAESRGARGDAM